MYRKLALNVTQLFIRQNIIDKNKKDIYQYGFELLISGIVYAILFLILSLFTHTVIPSIIFWLGLFGVRKTAGGHHSSSYMSCHLLFTANHILLIVLLKLIHSQLYFALSSSFLIFGCFCVMLLGPVDHKNKPFIKTEYKRYKIASRIYGLVLLGLFILTITKIIPSSNNTFSFSFGTLSASISLLCAKIIRFKERKEEKP